MADYESILTLLDWYAQHTRHCAVVILTECDKALLQRYTVGEDDVLTPDNISAWGLLEDVRKDYSADFNDKGLNFPAADWQKYPFPTEKYRRNVEVVRVIDNHEYDELIRRSMINHYVFATQYKISDKNRYNCCDWTEQVINDAVALPHSGMRYTSPNPAPFWTESRSTIYC